MTDNPLTDKPTYVIVGSHKRTAPDEERYSCMRCQGDVYLTPGNQEAMKRGQFSHAMCLRCSLREKDAIRLPPSAETIMGDLGCNREFAEALLKRSRRILGKLDRKPS